MLVEHERIICDVFTYVEVIEISRIIYVYILHMNAQSYTGHKHTHQ